MKSGCSPSEEPSLSGTTQAFSISLANNSKARARSPGLGLWAGRPTTASKKLAAGAAPLGGGGRYGHKPMVSSHSFAVSCVRRASPFWLQRASRAELSWSAFKNAFFRVGAVRRVDVAVGSVRAGIKCAEMRAESLLKNTVGQSVARADNWWDAPFAPARRATTPFWSSPAEYGF